MRVLFFGTPRAAVPSLRALRASRHAAVGVVCQPDRPAHRGHGLTSPPVKDAGLELGLPVLQPETTASAAFRAEVAALEPEAFAVVAYGRILGPKLLALAPHGAFNLHFSLLPRWRGAAPVQRALLAGDARTGVSIIRLVRELDAGPVLALLATPIGPEETTPVLEARLAQVGAALLLETLDAVEARTAREEEQDETLVTLAPPLRKEEGWMDFSRPAEELARQVRALEPWPGTRLRLSRGVVTVLEAVAVDDGSAAPGTLLPPRGDDLPVACGRGALLLRRVKPEGKAAMTGRSLVNGRWASAGDGVLPTPEDPSG